MQLEINFNKEPIQDNTPTVRIPLSNGGFTVIDAADLPIANRFSHWKRCDEGNNSYARSPVYIKGTNHKVGDKWVGGRYKVYALHRVIMNAQPHETVDHIDHDGLNNRRSNLRLGPQRNNSANNRRKVGKSGFRGVEIRHQKRGTKFLAGISECPPGGFSNNKGFKKYLGIFNTPEEAARAYDRAAIARWGEFATLNFPDPSKHPRNNKV